MTMEDLYEKYGNRISVNIGLDASALEELSTKRFELDFLTVASEYHEDYEDPQWEGQGIKHVRHLYGIIDPGTKNEFKLHIGRVDLFNSNISEGTNDADAFAEDMVNLPFARYLKLLEGLKGTFSKMSKDVKEGSAEDLIKSLHVNDNLTQWLEDWASITSIIKNYEMKRDSVYINKRDWGSRKNLISALVKNIKIPEILKFSYSKSKNKFENSEHLNRGNVKAIIKKSSKSAPFSSNPYI